MTDSIVSSALDSACLSQALTHTDTQMSTIVEECGIQRKLQVRMHPHLVLSREAQLRVVFHKCVPALHCSVCLRHIRDRSSRQCVAACVFTSKILVSKTGKPARGQSTKYLEIFTVIE